MDLTGLSQKSLSEMTTEEIHELLRQNRQSRRTVKTTEKATRAVTKHTEKKEKAVRMESAVAAMSPEDIDALIKRLEGNP